MDVPGKVNPHGPQAASEGVGLRRARRWLAILVSLVNMFAGTGLFLLGRSRQRWIWPGTSLAMVALYGLSAALAPRLVMPAILVMLLLWVGGLIATAVAPAGAFMEWPRTLLVAVALVAMNWLVARAVRFAAVEGFSIPSAGMNPTLLIGEHIVVTKLGSAARGDVIVFKYPLGPETDYIKRVISLPGETISIQRNQVFIDGKPIPRRALDEPCVAFDGDGACQLWEEQAGSHTFRVIQDIRRAPGDFAPKVIPAGSYFVMGDNRDNSNDSRVWGMLAAKLIKGRATVIYLSPGAQGQRWDRVGKPLD